MVRFHPRHPNVERRVRKCARPLTRHLQIEALVGVRQAKMAGRSGSTTTPLETVASAASAGVAVIVGSVSASSLIKRTSGHF